jgi:hypothetical protein
MKHNGNLNVTGTIASKRIIVGGFSGTTLTSGSYELPYPLGTPGSVFAITTNISGDKVLEFKVLDADILSYSPSVSGAWSPIPSSVGEALDTLIDDLNSHNHVIETLQTNELDISYLLQPNGIGGVEWKPSTGINLTNYYTKTQTDAITGQLQAEIDAIASDVATISANLGSKTFITLSDAPTSYVGKANEIVTVKPTEDGLDFTPMLSGSISCNTLDQAYIVSHPKLTSNSLPIVSLVLPTSGDTQYLASPTNTRLGAFDVVLTGIPMVTGYKINWFSLNNV